MPETLKQKVTQQALDASQYSAESIAHYEQVYGEDFVSPGGRDMARELIAGMALAPGSRVLDVGCGLGGSAFLMAREFDLKVDAIDLSQNMIDRAKAKLEKHGLAHSVTFEQGDCLELDRPGYYDAVYSRDVFLHIHDKAKLFGVLKSVTRSGGKLLFTDYCCGEQPWQADFAEYVEDRGYCLHTVDEYVAILHRAGFHGVKGIDLTDRFISILENELSTIPRLDLSGDERHGLAQSWQSKIDRARAGDQRWGLFTASGT
jgi:phosphoethanolamine N-methyltransferase